MQLSNFKSISKRGFNTLTNIPLKKGTVPKRLDLCYYFGTFYTILYLYFLTEKIGSQGLHVDKA